MLTVCCFKWQPHKGARSKFDHRHVNKLKSLFDRHLSIKHDFVCVTDDDRGIDQSVRTVELWPDLAHVPNPSGPREPWCHRRLKLFSKEAATLIGERVLWIDLDMMLVRDIRSIVDRPDDVVLLETGRSQLPINGSMVLVTPGAREDVWLDFDERTSPMLARTAGFLGSDQAWLAYKLLGKVPTWKMGPGRDGIYFYWLMAQQAGSNPKLPEDARLISFHGRGNPWDDGPMSTRWVRKEYEELNNGLG